MQLRTLLKPSLFPFLRVRSGGAMQQRRGGSVSAKPQAGGRGASADKGRRFVT